MRWKRLYKDEEAWSRYHWCLGLSLPDNVLPGCRNRRAILIGCRRSGKLRSNLMMNR